MENKELTSIEPAAWEKKDTSPAKEKINAFIAGSNTIPDFKNLDPTLRKQVVREFINNPQAIAKLRKVKADIDTLAKNSYDEYIDIQESIKLGSDYRAINNLSIIAYSTLGFAGIGPWKRMEDAKGKWEKYREKSENLLTEVFWPDAPPFLKL